METGPRLINWVKIFFPLLALVGLNISPVDLALYEKIGQAYLAERGNQPALAVIYLHEILQIRPWQSSLWEKAGLNLIQTGEDTPAIQDLERAEQVGSISIEGRIALAEAYERTEQLAEAARQWSLVIATRESPAAYEHLAQTWRETGDYDRSIDALRGWQSLEPLNPAVAYRLAVQLATLDADESLSQINEAARLDERYRPALDSLQRAFALAGLNDDGAYRLTVVGRALAGLGEWDLAENAFNEATRINPGYAEAWAFLGEARSQIGKDGLAELEKALELSQGSVLAQAFTALYWGRQENWDRAIEHIQAAARLEPQRSVWRIELGNLYAKKGDLVLALSEFTAAVNMDPNSGEALRSLARFCLNYGVDLEQTGLVAARRALAVDENDAQARDLSGAILVELGKAEEGERELLLALEIDPDLPEAHLHLGSLYLQRQDLERAYSHLERARQLDDGGETGEIARRLIERYFN